MRTDPLSVLVVDDEPAVRESLCLRIEDWGHCAAGAEDLAAAERLVAARRPDVVITDVLLQHSSGLDLLRRLMADDPRRAVILITAHGSIDIAVDAMKEGARDFLTKPLDHDKLKSLLDAIAAECRDRWAARALEARLDDGAGVGEVVACSRRMKDVLRLVERLASSDASAIITGESGTGKEVVARTIHALSGRRAGPFVAINAAAIPEGLIESELFGHEKGAFTGAVQARPGCFELASGGTLFLDEIAEMPLALQPKLLRVLEEGRLRRLGGSREVAFDVRVLAATNRPPADAARSGRLREDLFYRLNVFDIALPPLRERLDDVPLLAQHFVRDLNRKHGTAVEGLRDATHALLVAYPWPGNVRELRNLIERALILARDGWIEPRHLPAYLRLRESGTAPTIALPIGTTAAEAEQRLILGTLDHVGGNKSEAARQLGLDVKTIRKKLRAWGRAVEAS